MKDKVFLAIAFIFMFIFIWVLPLLNGDLLQCVSRAGC